MVMKARYTVIDGEVIAEKRNGVRSLYVPDPLGSTVALLDNTQTQTDTFGYWPYGENNGRTGTTAAPFQFVGTAGYYRDSGSRAYGRARTLGTQLGRWLTPDVVSFRSGLADLFAYAGDRPLTLIDPIGNKPLNPKLCRDLHPGQSGWLNCTTNQWNACVTHCGGINNVRFCCGNRPTGQKQCVCLRPPRDRFVHQTSVSTILVIGQEVVSGVRHVLHFNILVTARAGWFLIRMRLTSTII